MALLLDGIPVSSVTFAPSPRTVVSASFFHRLDRQNPELLLTIPVPPRGTFSTVINCTVSDLAGFDLVLGNDWACLFREYLVSLGHRLHSQFDPWQFYLSQSTSGPSALPVSPGYRAAAKMPLPPNSDSSSIVTGAVGPPRGGRAKNISATMKVKQYVPPTGKFAYDTAGPSRASARTVTRIDPDAQDALLELLLSSDVNVNIFTMPPKDLIKLLNSHHIPKPPDLTIAGARHALLSHLITGACIATCDPAFNEDHSCTCKQLCSVYPSQQAMSFAIISIILSASEDRLTDTGIEIIAGCMGWDTNDRSVVLTRMIERRLFLVQKHASSHTARVLFEQLDLLPKGTLMSIAQAHGLFFHNPTNDYLRQAITHHVGMGKCVSHEGYAPFLGCSSLESEFIPPTAEPGTCDDPSVRLQIHILRQLMPILKLRPLRRLLELHDVSYVESDKAKKLRQLMKSYLVRLRSGKYPDNLVGVPGSKRRQRAAESARLRKEWPQVVPARLKKKLLANFNLEISLDSLSTFICGSCSENCPMIDKCTLGFEDFDIDLLKRPDGADLEPDSDMLCQ
ncbi:hypothetical protein B0H13DRAFT_1855739 [Mycena leptocephala]|nr:hypothetical protein B0H13DRAFT_1855739 [Mycena leptocephala]